MTNLRTAHEELDWIPEDNDSGYVCVHGSAFGYRVHVEVDPTGSRWRVTASNLTWTGSSGSHDEAKRDALTCLGETLALAALGVES